ncbi:hypothetical protein DL764_005520 [Monosporascus ibericus]|uniref:Phospholipase A-2-activating protein n=1 Tax=Monosporascus ibericus TaxID=155417 RepID=A0A4Q4TBH7_9PEZI|nr:hypothetical protein DL764_005520 [Monosporascus ibericus]
MSGQPGFKLSAQLAGHDADVRDVLFPSPDLVLSASRDHTVRAWKLTSPSPPAFEVSITNQGSEFINSLAYLPPSSEYPQGLVVSAGTDSIIDVRPPTSTPADNADRLLIGHSRNVCALAVLPGERHIISGSWDHSARVWSVDKWESEVTLVDHQGAVWDVLPLDENTVVTGCADKSIRIFDLRKAIAGKVEPRSSIYTPDIVRALCRVPPGHPSGAEIASASNDGVIRLWKLTGQQVGELRGHESFIYCLTALPTGELVSSGEDRTVRIWSGFECIQTITHPAISVWSVATCAANGDIASGSSDGVIRVFSRSSDRVASPATLAQFDEAVKSSAIPQQQVGSVNKEKLPGPEFLQTKSGTKEGQVQMIKEDNGSITAHQWSMSQQQWVNVGTVVDSGASSGRKVEYNGKTWDYVFDVAIEEGQPSLKLPYNLSENPYDRATKFLNDNELPISYLDQVANFITTNTQGATIGQTSDDAGGADPYGTESRYRPGDEVSSGKARVIPQRDYLDITAAKYEPVFNKILKVNSALVAAGRKDYSLNPTAQHALAELRHTLEAGKPVTDETTINIVVMMCTQWDYSDRLAPLDVLRCIAPSPAVAKFQHPSVGSIIQAAVAGALDGVPAGSEPNENMSMMAARTIANLFKSAPGRKQIGSSKSDVDTAISFFERVLGVGGRTAPIGEFNRNLLVALATAMLNFAVLPSRESSCVARQVQVRLLDALVKILGKQNDGEVVFRALVATGTLITVVGPASPEAKSLKELIKGAGDRVADDRVKGVVAECLELIK